MSENNIPQDPGIKRLLKNWERAVQGSDYETLASLVTEDAEFWTHKQPPLIGRTALKNAFKPLFELYQAEQAFECLEMRISGNLAFLRGIETNRISPLEGTGEPRVRRQRAFSILQREQDGEWRFARGMTNLPPEEAAETPG